MDSLTKLRSYIIAPKGKSLIACDLSQAETWVVAYLSRDVKMKDALLHSDIHTETASFLFKIPLVDVKKGSPERFLGKKTNHAASYGMSAPRFAESVNTEADSEPYLTISIAEARKHLDNWHRLYTGIKTWWKEVENELYKTRKLVTPYGRVRLFHGALVHETFKQAYAYKPQSTVGDHFNGAVQKNGPDGGLLKIWRRFKNEPGVKIINQAHDSLLMEAPSDSAKDIGLEVKSILHRPIVINNESCLIPVDLEIGERWGELEYVI